MAGTLTYTEIDRSDLAAATQHLISLTRGSPITIDIKKSTIAAILADLRDDSLQTKWNDDLRLNALQVLKIFGRDYDGSDEIFTRDTFHLLVHYATLDCSPDQFKGTLVTQEACKIISNAVLIKDYTRQFLVDAEVDINASRVLSRTDLSVEAVFLLSRILFLITISSNESIFILINDLDIVNSLAYYVTKYTDMVAETSLEAYASSPMSPVSILTEQLKIVFNLMIHYKRLDQSLEATDDEMEKARLAVKPFVTLIDPLVSILIKIPTSDPIPVVAPHSHAIHALINYPIGPYREQLITRHQQGNKNSFLDLAINMLDHTLKFYKISHLDDHEYPSGHAPMGDEEMHEIISPLIIFLSHIALEDSEGRVYIRKYIIPDDLDRSSPPEKGDHLTGRCIRVLQSSVLPLFRDAMGELLLAICDSDANKLIESIGYGNAAGFLLAKNMLFPPPSSTESNATNGSSSRPIDLMTGQYVDDDVTSDLKKMTDEEKEAEAERLFVLFERLNKTGVIQTMDPRLKAQEEGRFEEIEELIAKTEQEKLEKEDIKNEEEAGKSIKEWKGWLKNKLSDNSNGKGSNSSK